MRQWDRSPVCHGNTVSGNTKMDICVKSISLQRILFNDEFSVRALYRSEMVPRSIYLFTTGGNALSEAIIPK